MGEEKREGEAAAMTIYRVKIEHETKNFLGLMLSKSYMESAATSPPSQPWVEKAYLEY